MPDVARNSFLWGARSGWTLTCLTAVVLLSGGSQFVHADEGGAAQPPGDEANASPDDAPAAPAAAAPAADEGENAGPQDPFERAFLDQQRMVRRVREINQPLNAEGADKAYLKNRSQVSSMMSAGGSLNAQQKKLIESAFAYKLFQMTDPTFAASPGDVRNLMTEVHRELNTAGKFQANPASLQRFREGVCEIVHPLLMQMMNNNLDARL
ncbi:MAG: hypothetical protein KDA85_11420, partial [Planctomycetaceae bacterium]|nr:hypothetical protein [Planctomycetaceae bacterium]